MGKKQQQARKQQQQQQQAASRGGAPSWAAAPPSAPPRASFASIQQEQLTHPANPTHFQQRPAGPSWGPLGVILAPSQKTSLEELDAQAHRDNYMAREDDYNQRRAENQTVAEE